MRQTIVSLICLLLTCAGVQRSTAQQDTTHLDVSYLTLNKEFTQQISIKGADLQKMPFINLGDAISAWLYGAYTLDMVQYVVDGNPVADVNAYSVYDVEEVVLVHHAAALIGTAPGQTETILIRTRRGKGPGGITVAAQTGLISQGGPPSTPRFFHNYYAGAYGNLQNISYGVSANYIRDAIPYDAFEGAIVTPPNWQRWRLNGYFDWRPDEHNQVEVTMNYTTQQLNGQMNLTSKEYMPYAYKESGYQHYLTPHLDWRGEWAKGLTNDLQATYLHSRLSTNELQLQGYNTPDSFFLQDNISLVTSYHLWIRDHLTFAVKTGGWTIEPAINVSYEHINEEGEEGYMNGLSTLPQLDLGDSYEQEAGFLAIGEKTNLFLVTPGVDLSYKRAIDIMGGALINAGAHSLTGNGKQVYPYAGAAVDLLRLGNPERQESLKVFGSVASRTITSSQAYLLQDFTEGNLAPISGFTTGQSLSVGPGLPPLPQPPPNYLPPVLPTFWTWEAGMRYITANGRLEASYQFEHRISAGLGTETYSNGWEGPAYPEWYSELHHLDIRVKVVEMAGASWRTGFNVTGLRTTVKQGDSTTPETAPIGEMVPTPWSWTGGWINRIRVKDFTAGLDLLYHFNEAAGYYGKLNSVATPNVYVGYEMHTARARMLEVYVESRDLIESHNSDVTDPRRYYTIGGKLTM